MSNKVIIAAFYDGNHQAFMAQMIWKEATKAGWEAIWFESADEVLNYLKTGTADVFYAHRFVFTDLLMEVATKFGDRPMLLAYGYYVQPTDHGELIWPQESKVRDANDSGARREIDLRIPELWLYSSLFYAALDQLIDRHKPLADG